MALSIRDDVVFVTSDKSTAQKSQLVQVERGLENKRISSSRVAPDTSLRTNLAQRHPHVLVLDYLLDSYGTAVDLLNSGIIEKQTQILIWTDEPALEIAVELMKLGADEYILSTAAKSVDKVVNTIAQWIPEESSTEDKPRARPTCIANSLAMQRTLALADSIASTNSEVACIFGAAGSGRNTIAREIHRLRHKHSQKSTLEQLPSGLIELDWDLHSPGKNENLTAFITENIPRACTIFIDHMDTDSGEFIEELPRITPWLEKNSILLLLGFKNDSFQQLCSRILPKSLHCEIPPINQRAEDIIPLFNSTLTEGQMKLLPLTSAFIKKLLSLTWPGNIHQLLSCVRESIHFAKPSQTKKGAEAEDSIFTLIQEAHDRWIRLHTSQKNTTPSLLAVSRAYYKSGCSLRRTAAMLGCTTRYVSQVVTRIDHETSSRKAN